MSSFKKALKSFKPATLDTEAVDADTLDSKKQQLWHFTFPQDFNVAAFSELELHLPAEPISSTSQVAQHVASFELDGVSYRLIEGSVFETSDIVNLFPSATRSGELTPGKPFARNFRICRDVTFPAPPKPIPVNPRGRAPEQLVDMRKNFFPVGYVHESIKLSPAEAEQRRGTRRRETSSRPGSPRLLPMHGFDIKEWRRPATATSAKGGKASDADAAAEAKRKAEKAKRKADAAEEPSAKKSKKGEDGTKKKKKDAK